MNRKALTTRDDFQYWLMDMDDAMERLLAELQPQNRKKLDFSPFSLDVLEAWILERYESPRSMLEREQKQIVNGAACYVGETFRKALSGRWDIELDDPNYVYFGVPILRGLGGKSTTESECPLSLATASADRRTGTYLRTVLENMIKRLMHTG